MRIQRRGRVSLVAATALAATAALAGCGSGGSGADDKSVTIWSSLDQPVQDGLEKTLTTKAKAKGITIKWQKVDNINQLIMQKIQANDTPDIAFIPQPGVVGDIVKRGKAFALDDVARHGRARESMTPGTLESGTVDGKLYGLLVSMNVKSLVFYPKKACDAAGYKAPTTIDELTPSPRRSSPTATPRGAWASSPTPPPAGPRPTGSRTSSCATAARTSTTSGSRTRPSSTPPSSRRRRPSSRS